MISKGWPSCAKDGDKLAGPECCAKYERSMRKAFVAAVVTLAIAVAGTACDEPQATDSPGPEPVDRVQRSQAGPQPPTAFPASPQPPTAPQAPPQPPTAPQASPQPPNGAPGVSAASHGAPGASAACRGGGGAGANADAQSHPLTTTDAISHAGPPADLNAGADGCSR